MAVVTRRDLGNVDLGDVTDSELALAGSAAWETDFGAAELTDDLAAVFLEEFKRSGSIRASARALGVNRMTAYRLRYDDAEFRNAWDALRTRRLRDAGTS